MRGWSMSHADALRPANQVLKSTAVLSHCLCAAIRWPLTRTRAGLARRGWILRLPCRQRTRRTSCHAPVGATLAVARALHILLRFRRAGCPHPAVMVRVGNGGASRRRPLRNSIGKRSVGADAYIGPPRRISCNLSLRSQCAHWLWQSVLFHVLHSNGGISTIFAEKGL